MNQKLVLIVDDEPQVRACFKAMIEGFGYQTDVAEDGEKGYDKFCQNVPDMILLDFRMPGIDGPTLAHHIRANHPERKTRIIGCTAITGAIPTKTKRDFNEILHKPVSYALLEKTLAEQASYV